MSRSDEREENFDLSRRFAARTRGAALRLKIVSGERRNDENLWNLGSEKNVMSALKELYLKARLPYRIKNNKRREK